MSFGARALIRLGALKHNLEVVRRKAPGAKIMAVIKANAYGHGMVAVAKSLPDVDAFAVARVPEAIELRDNGVTNSIILLAGVLNEDEMRSAVQQNLQPVVHCQEQLELLASCSTGSVSTWLKFDTGMNRLGFDRRRAAKLIDTLNSLPSVRELGLMTHLSSADELDNETTDVQTDQFWEIASGFGGRVSIANSAGILGWPETIAPAVAGAGDIWIRPGIVLYGISPFDSSSGVDLGLKPVMQFEARLIATKPLIKGARVGYKAAYESKADTVLGVISAGYGDGYSRHFRAGTPVLINGRKVQLIGNVSMDMITVDLGPNATDRVGDVATLWGDGLPVEEVAPWANAIPYELVCGVMNREASKIVDHS
jgi:alanine racemase